MGRFVGRHSTFKALSAHHIANSPAGRYCVPCPARASTYRRRAAVGTTCVASVHAGGASVISYLCAWLLTFIPGLLLYVYPVHRALFTSVACVLGVWLALATVFACASWATYHVQSLFSGQQILLPPGVVSHTPAPGRLSPLIVLQLALAHAWITILHCCTGYRSRRHGENRPPAEPLMLYDQSQRWLTRK